LDVKAAGSFTIQKLRSAGFNLSDFQEAGCNTIQELRSAGFKLSDFKAAGYTIQELRSA
jgi:biotin operon repressor